MKRSISLFWLFVAPVSAGEKLEVEILGRMDLSGTGTFEVSGEAAEYLCPFGTLESANIRIEWLTDDTFKIWQDKVSRVTTRRKSLCLNSETRSLSAREGVPGRAPGS